MSTFKMQPALKMNKRLFSLILIEHDHGSKSAGISCNSTLAPSPGDTTISA
jgi:hypothetical protein